MGAGEIAQWVRYLLSSQTWKGQIASYLETITVKVFFLRTAKLQ